MNNQSLGNTKEKAKKENYWLNDTNHTIKAIYSKRKENNLIATNQLENKQRQALKG